MYYNYKNAQWQLKEESMTEFEKKLIALLKDNARYTYKELAAMTNSDEKTVAATMKSLEESGIILKYAAIVNDEKIDENVVGALIEVKVTPQARSGFDSIAKDIVAFDEVKSVYLMSGTFDLAITLEGKSVRDISLFVSERLSTLDCITATATHFFMKKYKDGGVPYEIDEDNRRLPFSE